MSHGNRFRVRNSADEADAFMTAWQPELFGDTPERARVEMVGTPPFGRKPTPSSTSYP